MERDLIRHAVRYGTQDLVKSVVEDSRFRAEVLNEMVDKWPSNTDILASVVQSLINRWAEHDGPYKVIQAPSSW